MDTHEDLDIPICRCRGAMPNISPGPLGREQTTSPVRKQKKKAKGKKSKRHQRTRDPEEQTVNTPSPAGGETQGIQPDITNLQNDNGESGSARKGHGKPLTNEILTENDPYIDLEPEDEEENLIRYFMTKDGDLPRRAHRADVVESRYPRNTLKELQSNGDNVPVGHICLIDDRTNDGIHSTPLGDYRPLNRCEVYLKLKNPRFHEENKTSPESTPLNADRRLIYITDPDSYAVTALITTAPKSQVIPLGDTIYRYTDFKPHIGFIIESRGFPFFSLSFHLPCFAWRSTPVGKEPRDPRLDRNGNPLRKVLNLGFLGGDAVADSSSETIDYLCEVQTSVLVTGIDDYRWTAFCLVDTYFEDEKRREHVDKYSPDLNDLDVIQTDPFREGIGGIDLPILNPREHFLDTLDCRARAFGEEWHDTADKLERKINRYIKECSLMSTTPTAGFKQSLAWIGRTREHLRELVNCLDATIKSWKWFRKRRQFKGAKEAQYMALIDETFVDAGHCVNKLISLCTRCDDHAKDIKLYICDEGNSSTKLQARLTKYTQTMTYITIYFVSPPGLAAAMLSMQEKAIPGVLGPTKLSFWVLTVVLAVLVIILERGVHCWESILLFIQESLSRYKVKVALGSLAGSGRVNEDIERGVREPPEV